MAEVLGGDYDRILKPLDGASPFGEDLKSDSLFFDLRTEIQKLTASSSKDTVVEWPSVKKWSVELLATKSKDLTVACYLTLALFLLDGYGGLLDGLGILRKFVVEDWDGVFPVKERMRPRILAFEWLISRLSPLVETRAPRPEEGRCLAPIGDAVKDIRVKLTEVCGHQAPGFGILATAVTNRLNEVQAATPAPAVAPAPEAAPAAPAGAAAAAAEAPSAPAQTAVAAPTAPIPQVTIPANATIAALRPQLLKILGAMREAEPLNPVPYRTLRSLKWDSLDGPPLVDPASGKTRLEPPRAQQRQALEGLFQAAKWTPLLNAAEGAFQEASGTFWLDLQRYAVTSLDNLAPGSTVAELVKADVARFLDRCRGAVGAAFSDGSPFANPATVEWAGEVASNLGGRASFAAPAAAAGADAATLDQAMLDEVMQHFAKKKPHAALEILQTAVDRASGSRARFRTRLAASRACLLANQTTWARPLLDDLLRETRAFSFESWEPELAVELLQLAAVCYGRIAKDRKTEDKQSAKDLHEEHLAKLFRLDMRAAGAVADLV